LDRRPGVNLPRLDEITEPAWVWDIDRARVVAANEAALSFWDEPMLADLLSRDFDPRDDMSNAIDRATTSPSGEPTLEQILPLRAVGGPRPTRCQIEALTLPDGRRGALIKVMGEVSAPDLEETKRLASAALEAPTALMSADMSGRIVAENEAARELFGEGRELELGQRIGSGRIATSLIEECMAHGRASRTRTIPTRFGLRLCRLTARRGEDPITHRPTILVQAMDVQDERARVSENEAYAAALADFLRASTDFYLELDYDLRIMRASAGVAQLLGIGGDDLVGMHWREIAGRSNIQISREIDLALGARSGWEDAALELIEADSRRQYLTTAHVLTNDRGDFRGYRLVARAAEAPSTAAGVMPFEPASVGRRRAAFAEMVESAPWACVVHRDWKPLYINRAFTEIFGLEEGAMDEPEGIPLAQFLPGAEAALSEDNARLMQDDLAYAVREISLSRGEDAAPQILQLRARRIDWESAPAIEYVIEDVSAYRRAGASGEASSSAFTAMLDMMPEAVFLLRANGRIEWANLAAFRMLELPDAGPPPHDLSDVLSPEDTSWAQDYVVGLAKGGLAHLFAEGREVAVVTSSGDRVPALLALERVGTGEPSQVCAVLRDISEWRNAEEKQNNAPAEAKTPSMGRTEFLAKVSHELRTPLTAILGFSQVMARQELGPVGNPRYVEYAKDILNSGDHLLSLINDLLDMSKVESGKLNLNFESVDLYHMAEGCTRLMSPIAGSRQVTLRHTVDDTLPSVVADERSVRQILLNLISNALRFTEEGGEVCVSAELDEGGGLVLAVTDTGVGMNEEELALALEPFEQVEKTVSEGTPGTGLGLPLARALTEANRAFFRIESAPRAGTRVSITFASTQVLEE